MKSILKKLQEVKYHIDLTGRAAARLSRIAECRYVESLLSSDRYRDPRSLTPHRFKVLSQFGQDGMIGEIFNRIGPGQKRAVEIGVAPLENNTGFLLLQDWQALWMDAALPDIKEFPEGLRRRAEAGTLHCDRSFLYKSNVRDLVTSAGFSEIDFLSVDIDYNTYHLFSELLPLRPRAVSVEYNSQFPMSFEWVAPYREDAVWDWSLAYGASLKALEIRAREHGYQLVGCELSGTDAFFVREDLLGQKFHEPFTSEHHWEPPRFFLDHSIGHLPGFPGPSEMADLS